MKSLGIAIAAALTAAASSAARQPPQETEDVLGEGLGRIVPAIEKLETRFHDLVAVLPLLGVALVIVLVFHLLGRRVVGWDRLFERFSANAFFRELLRQLTRTAIVLAGLLLALEVLDATALVGALLGTAGVVGLAVGFALRDLVENYIASVLLSLRQPFAPNDFVKIGAHEGKVIRLTSRATVLMTLDGNHLRIPNADVFKGVILNYTRNPLRRFDFGVGVGFGADLAAAERLGLEVVAGIPGVLADPEPMGLVEELGDSNVRMRFYAWVDQRESNLGKVKSEAIRLVKTAFDAAEIEVQEPIQRVRMERGAAKPPAEPPPAAPPEFRGDLAADDAVDRQIAVDRTKSGERDLLDESAPRE